MLTLAETVEIYVCLKPADMRKSFDSLARLVEEFMAKSPLSGHLFVFINKRRSMLKILFWDRTGYCQYYKRLESGTVSLPVSADEATSSIAISNEQLHLILDGVNIWGYQAKKT